jgi:hypothetical protein
VVEEQMANRRRVLISVGVALALAAALLSIALIARSKTPFDREQAHAEAMNPPWISVEIRTADNRQEYREGEPIILVAQFSSAKPYMYKIETAEEFSYVANETIHVSNGKNIIRPGRFVCCFSHLIGLDEEPYRPHKMNLPALPPEWYEIYVTSRRVFKWDEGPMVYQPSSMQVASNLLKIRVVSR